ncbi:trypsin-like serine peptidase [Zavarzinella formosa]|uniref:trypsin-like serine peptidase n=1 Tax=Zavarzinella formosa TaxID=360055 RepID=UPI000361AC41|nr:trypsin-like peptidase domain-containing protein [Zavarzinella formosa]
MAGRLYKSCAKDGVIAYQDETDVTMFHYFPARIDAIDQETIIDYDVKYYGINAKPYFVDLGNRNYQSCVGSTTSGQAIADITAAQRKAITAECIKIFKVKEVNLVPLTLQDVTVQPIIAKNVIEMGEASTVTFPDEFKIGTQFGFNVNAGNSLFAELVGNYGSEDRTKSPDIGVNFYGIAELRADPWVAQITADLSQVWEYTRNKFSMSVQLGWINIGGVDIDNITQELQKKNIVKIKYIEGGGGKEFGRALLETTKSLFESINQQITSGEGLFKFEPNPAPQEPPAQKDSLGGDLLPWRVSINASFAKNTFKQSILFDQTVTFEGMMPVAFNGNMSLALACNAQTKQHFYDLQMKEVGCISKEKSDGLQKRISKEISAKDAKIKEYLKNVESGRWTPQQYGEMLGLLNKITLTESPKLSADEDSVVGVLSEAEVLELLSRKEEEVHDHWEHPVAVRDNDRLHKVFPPDDRKQVTNTTVAPFDGVGLLEMTFPNGKVYTGTGTLIDGTHVLTAAHNLFDNRDGGKATKITFTPAQNGPPKPKTTIDALRWDFPADFEKNEGDDTLDYGVVTLKSEAPKTATKYKVKVASDKDLSSMEFQVAGYPGDKASGTMWYGKGKLTKVLPKLLQYKISTYEGESGAAVAAKDSDGWSVFGIHDGGTVEANQACRITDSVKQAIDQWCKRGAISSPDC